MENNGNGEKKRVRRSFWPILIRRGDTQMVINGMADLPVGEPIVILEVPYRPSYTKVGEEVPF